MWGGLILLLLLLLFFALFLIPVKLRIAYDGDVTLTASVLGVRIPLVPKRKKRPSLWKFSWKRHKKRLRNDAKKEQKKRLKQAEKEKKKQAKKLAKKKEKEQKSTAVTVKDEPSMVSLLLSLAGGILEKFCGMLRIEVVRLHITVGGPNAAKIALTYGLISQGIAYLLELLSMKTDYSAGKKDSIHITPNFLAAETTADISLVFSLRLWHIVNILCTSVYRFIKEKIRRESAHI